MNKQEIELFYTQLQKIHNDYLASTPESKPKQFAISNIGTNVVSPNEIAVSFNIKFILNYDIKTLKLGD